MLRDTLGLNSRLPFDTKRGTVAGGLCAVKCWVNTISRDHVQAGVAGGFTQAGHGKAAGLKRLNAGDRLVFYSPKTSLHGGEPLRAFTAIGRVADDRLYQAEMAPEAMGASV